MPIMRFKVEERSMEPTLYPGDTILARKYFNLRKGDVVIFKHPEKEIKLVKRVAKIENGRYLVEGDNKEMSSDSRKFGMIERESIIGKVMFLKSKDE